MPEDTFKRIRKQYGAVTDDDVATIAAAERENAQCRDCKGYPCLKTGHKGELPIVTVDKTWGVVVTYEVCKPYVKHEFQTRLENAFREAKIPHRYLRTTYKDYHVDADNEVAVAFAKNVLKGGYSGAFFYGKPGTGKTFLASLIAKDFIKVGKSVKFCNVSDVLNAFQDVYRDKTPKTEQEILAEYEGVDLLILDDIVQEKVKMFTASMLGRIINARYNRNEGTTIITSNYNVEKVAAILDNPTDARPNDECLNGTRIRDRCLQWCKTIYFKEGSRRLES